MELAAASIPEQRRHLRCVCRCFAQTVGSYPECFLPQGYKYAAYLGCCPSLATTNSPSFQINIYIFFFLFSAQLTSLPLFSAFYLPYFLLSLSRCGNQWKRAEVTSEADKQEEEKQPDLLLILPSLFFTVSLQGSHYLSACPPACLPACWLARSYFAPFSPLHTHIQLKKTLNTPQTISCPPCIRAQAFLKQSHTRTPAHVSLCVLLIFHPACLMPWTHIFYSKMNTLKINT